MWRTLSGFASLPVPRCALCRGRDPLVTDRSMYEGLQPQPGALKDGPPVDANPSALLPQTPLSSIYNEKLYFGLGQFENIHPLDCSVLLFLVCCQFRFAGCYFCNLSRDPRDKATSWRPDNMNSVSIVVDYFTQTFHLK